MRIFQDEIKKEVVVCPHCGEDIIVEVSLDMYEPNIEYDLKIEVR